MEIEFDITPIPQGERFEFWHDVGSLVHRPIRTATSLDAPLDVRARFRISPTMIVGMMRSNEQCFERTEQMVKSDHVDSIQLVLLKNGSVNWTARGRSFNAQAGDLILLDNHEVCQSSWTSHQQIYAVLPRDLVSGSGWHGTQKRVLRSGSSFNSIISHYLHTIWASRPSESHSSTLQLAQGLASLTRIYFSEEAPLLETDSTPEPIKQTIQRWINKELHNPDLDAALICSAFYLSRSSLYELFKPEGGIRTYLQECRLKRARLILENPGRQLSISTIARMHGFASLSSFSRSFRDRWGLAPRVVRKRALETSKDEESATQPINQPNCSEHLKEILKDYYNSVNAISSKT